MTTGGSRARRRWLSMSLVAAGVTLLAACGSVDEGTEPTNPGPTSVTTAAAPAPGAPGGRCATASLRVTLGHSSGTAGHVRVPVLFTNKLSTACMISGYPGIAYTTGPGGKQIGDAAVPAPGQRQPVRLEPGGTASALVDETDVGVFPGAACDPTPVAGLRVNPPSGNSSTFVAQPGARACVKHLPGRPQLRVGPVVHGTSGT